MSFTKDDIDYRVRSSVFAWLRERQLRDGEALPWRALSEEFFFDGERVPLIGANGIFKPRVLPEIPISITTSPNSPYEDDLRAGGGTIHYKFRGNDPNHHDNRGLMLAMQRQTPLVYFLGTRKGWYLASFPVFVSAADPASLTFVVQMDDELSLRKFISREHAGVAESDAVPRREYVTATTKRRLHQAAFRDRVIAAYKTQCALCRLRHASLLDAAHIIPDSDPDGAPVVSNGLSLCKIHHAAFDGNFLGVNPDYKVSVRPDLLEEVDGPMLQHGIKEMHGQKIQLPGSKSLMPNRDFLERRFEDFKKAFS